MSKTYTNEYKKQAVELAQSLGNFSSAAKQLGISDSLIHAWKKQLLETAPEDKKLKALSDAQTELQKLRKENAELKKVNIILKAAAAFFSQDHLK